jgi:hypothetical protein
VQNHAGNGPAILTQFNEIADKSRSFMSSAQRAWRKTRRQKQKPPIMILP